MRHRFDRMPLILGGLLLAFLLAARARGPVVGLTSRANREFVAGLSYYDEVVCYDELQSLSPDEPIVFVDMSGDGYFDGSSNPHPQHGDVWPAVRNVTPLLNWMMNEKGIKIATLSESTLPVPRYAG